MNKKNLKRVLRRIIKFTVTSLLILFIGSLLSWFIKPVNAEAPEDEFIYNIKVLEDPSLEDFAKEIQRFEGWFEGSRSYRNNNPGNLVYSKFQTGHDGKFSIFNTEEEGFNALLHYLGTVCDGSHKRYDPQMTITEFFYVYAPPSDNNDPDEYARSIRNNLGVDTGFTISEFCGL